MNLTRSDNNLTLQCYLPSRNVSTPLAYVHFSLLLISSLMAAFGNTIALVVFFQARMRSKSNNILVSLAFSDALVGYVVMPFIAIQIMLKETMINCQINYVRDFFASIPILTSGYAILFTSNDRYISLTRFERYHDIVTNKKVKFWICLSWCFSISLSFLHFVGKFGYIYPIIVVSRMLVVTSIILSLILIIIHYFLIIKAIRTSEKSLRPADDDGSSNTTTKEFHKNRRRKLAKKVTILILCYIVCFIPAVCLSILVSISSKRFQNFFIFATFLVKFNSCLNPIIYTAKYTEFRTLLRKWTKCIRQEKRIQCH